VTKWAEQQLIAVIRQHRSGLILAIDPDELLDDAPLSDTAITIVDDWWQLRSAYERDGRWRPVNAPPLVLVLHPPLAAADIPWDIEQRSGVVATVRLPGPPHVRAALRDLDDDELTDAVDAIRSNAANPEGALLQAVSGVAIGNVPLSSPDQLRLAARIATRSDASSSVSGLARRWVTDPALVGLLRTPIDPAGLQLHWDAFIGGATTGWHETFRRAAPELAALFAARILEPSVASTPLEPWAHVGVREISDEDRAAELLAAPPNLAPTELADWHTAALWWGEVRRLTARGSAELRAAAWAVWEQLDDAFIPWLRARYGTLLTSAATWPTTVHRVAPFLARRIRDRKTERIMLVVLDGLGHAQWSHLLERLPLDVAETGCTFAMVPTYTTVSRQAIFAGDLPQSSPDTLWTTQPERRRWSALWEAEGIPVTRVAYHRVRGRLPHDHLGFGDAQVIGVVVNAVDDLMHSSELFGDAQLLANLDVWAESGFLTDLIARANAAGYETWITSDHGNLECLGAGSVSEGVAIEAAGKRLLRYPNRTLRDASAARGTVWDEIPGLPATAEPLLFASGRDAFTRNLVSVSHGGLSIDEVIVPLARVST